MMLKLKYGVALTSFAAALALAFASFMSDIQPDGSCVSLCRELARQNK
jgi:hypothetical protein